MLNDEYQSMAANGICHAASMASIAWQQAAASLERPSVLWKPKIFIDGNQWIALYGDNLQDGVVGHGDSPELAMHSFDAAWSAKLTKEQSK